ncbi:MAG: protein-export chaperone SecB [Alphaproteobacteria bacterium]|nr:protein-export chaperone SecB [Alphaproteobacteria bacterium]
MAETPQNSIPQPAQVQVGLGAQYIKDFSFESPNAPQVFASLQNQPQLNIDVNVLSRSLGEGAFEAVLQLKLDSKVGGKTAFIAELAYAGVFVLPQMPEEQLRMFLLVEAPRLLFPFARAILANAVREGGFPNLVIQPIDFLSLYAQQRNGVGGMTAAGAA